ncbi:MAG: hypothetical protein ACO1TE_21600 [Prosthecobacter sp.]
MLWIFRASSLLACFACGTLLLAEETRAPADMTTKVFKLPFNFMELGIVKEPDPAVPDSPVDPFAAPAPPLAADPFGLPTPFPASPSSPVLTFKSSRKILEETGVTFPPGASALFDPVRRELTLHNTPEMLELTEAFVSSLHWHGSTPTIVFTVTVVEGPGEVIRQANAAASRHANAAPVLEALLTQAAEPDSGVQIVKEMRLEENSGTRGTVEAVLERAEVEISKAPAASSSDKTATPPETESSEEKRAPESDSARTRQDGMSLELEGRLDEEGKMLAVTFGLDFGPAPAAVESGDQALVPPSSPAEENEDAKIAEVQAPPSLRRAHFRTALSMSINSAKLIGITKPTGRHATLKTESQDTLWAAFLNARVRHLQPAVLATSCTAPERLPPGQRAVAFQVPEGLLETVSFQEGRHWWPPQPLNTWLERTGITFPAGASMEHRDGRLLVVNTPENIELISALMDHAWGKADHDVAFTLHTFQMPATLMRLLVAKHSTAAEDADDSALLAAVEAATAHGEAMPVGCAFFEGKNGVRSRHESGLQHSLMTRFGSTPTAGEIELGFERQAMGTVMEIEPTVSADGRSVDFVCSHEIHLVPPAIRRQGLRAADASGDHDLPGADLQVLRTVTAIAMASGTTKLLSLHRPNFGVEESGPFDAPAGDDPEMLWATFLQAHVVPLVKKQPEPKPSPLTPEQADTQRIIEKMNKIIIPEVRFDKVSLEQAVEFLRAKSRELDTSTDAGREKGVNIVLRPSALPSDASLTLHLQNVPMSEALRYVTELAQLSYRVDANVVSVGHGHDGEGRQFVRTFRVPPDFLSIGDTSPAPAQADVPANPFFPTPAAGASASHPKARKTAKQILESQGITFPEGSSATFVASTGTLLVRNTQPNLDLVEAFCDCRCIRPHIPVAITAQVLQGPGALLRRIAAQAAPLNDHRAMLDELLAAVKAGMVQHLDTARIETRSGTRAATEQGRESTELTGLTLDGKGGSIPQHAALFSGLRLEMEPICGSDGASISLTIGSVFHTAPPSLRREHLVDHHGRRLDFPLADTHLASLVTGLTLLDGHARLLHLWKPTGKPEFEKEDVLQVMFITCDVLRAVE